ncbi:MAG: DegT/DnrJ/EryC1/StrS family aminotransferase [FCB group bacterium]|nr:DegT/DnrJ/EryC1/StrS family aminotransferase [FCB group bacterium]
MADKTQIPHNQPTLGLDEEKAAAEVIRSGWIAQGSRVAEFESNFAGYASLPETNAVALSSGTSALYVALKLLDLPTDSEIIIPTYVCSALLNAIHMAGCLPVLVDVNETDFNLTVDGVKAAITDKTGAIIVVHMFGYPADTVGLTKLGLPVIEDCATALGSSSDGKAVGLTSDIGIFSFYPSKMIATGQGGMLVSKNKDITDRARDYREFDGREDYYPRFNFHLTDLQAAVGIVQLKRLPDFLKARNQIGETYRAICEEKGWDYQRVRSDSCHLNFYRFVIKGEMTLIEKIKADLIAENIETIIPVEKWELLHNYLKLDATPFPIAERLSAGTLSLPIYPRVADNKILSRISRVLRAV